MNKGANSRSADMSRRRLLGLGASAALTLAAGSARALVPERERSLAFRQLHTGESLRTVYWADGEYQPEALNQIDHLLRDHRVGSATSMDRGLLDLMHALQRAVGSRDPFEIISGYRSPETNDALRRNGGGVARRSYHMRGMAVDLRLPGCDLATLRRAAGGLRRGGVGYYPESDFVHIDTGRVRFW